MIGESKCGKIKRVRMKHMISPRSCSRSGLEYDCFLFLSAEHLDIEYPFAYSREARGCKAGARRVRQDFIFAG